MVTAVQMRTRCVSIKLDGAPTWPEAPTQGSSVFRTACGVTSFDLATSVDQTGGCATLGDFRFKKERDRDDQTTIELFWPCPSGLPRGGPFGCIAYCLLNGSPGNFRLDSRRATDYVTGLPPGTSKCHREMSFRGRYRRTMQSSPALVHFTRSTSRTAKSFQTTPPAGRTDELCIRPILAGSLRRPHRADVGPLSVGGIAPLLA